MTIENTIQNLADAIDRLASVYSNAMPTGRAPVTQGSPDAAPTPTRRKPATKAEPSTLPENALVPDTSGDTEPAEAANPVATEAAKAVATTIVDAGSGKPITIEPEAPAGGIDRAAVKVKGNLLAGKKDGPAQVVALLRKHCGTAEGDPNPTFSKVPDEALPAFAADVDAALAMMD